MRATAQDLTRAADGINVDTTISLTFLLGRHAGRRPPA